MRLPGAALLLAIGLTILWLAATGSLDKLANVWLYLSGKVDITGAKSDLTVQPASCDPSKGVCDYSNVHVQSLVNSIGSGSSLTNPGGML
jgi:hypothetical protein